MVTEASRDGRLRMRLLAGLRALRAMGERRGIAMAVAAWPRRLKNP
jgi:hypothetical protein